MAEAEADLAEVRRQGFRVAPSRQAVGVTDLSVPVLGPSGDAMAVLTCAYIEHPGDTGAGQRDATLACLVRLARSLALDLPT
ncbi:hypothetical protein [Paracoccus sp. MKU1]|uniref:hypothetical protein n=1 Tax=Paracoccus sp. MKU1 TaxID=1745182 RepID=UPI0007191932|nr:hypothetical protein [Paracoccus sp. MKU1]KRW95247.1 hypothetical protein AQY21_15740 [Paracoccus sp. MKU1]